MNPVLIGIAGDLRRRWKDLFVASFAFKVSAFVLLTPLVAIVFRGGIWLSGSDVLADQDILYFFLGPVGCVCLIVVGALWLGIVALEISALMAVVAAPSKRRVGTIAALYFAARHVWPVLRLTARLTAYTALAVVPFLAAAAVVYFTLLTEFDINYYLTEKPSEFLVALGLAAVLGLAMAAVLLRLWSGWFFALPLVLFEDASPKQSVQMSRQRAVGHRRVVLLAMLAWWLAMAAISTLVTLLIVMPARSLVPLAAGSLTLLAVAIGLTMLLWGCVSLLVNLLSTAAFAVMHFYLYRQHVAKGRVTMPPWDGDNPAATAAPLQLTRGRLVAASIVGVVAAVGVGYFAVSTVRLEDDVVIIAHRGASSDAPENTLAAVTRAIDDGTNFVEIDVQETADGKVVVMHDSDFMKLAGVSTKVWNGTLTELQQIDIGSWFETKFQNERVPTLAAVLDACKGKVGLVIELKYYGHDQRLERRVADLVEAHDMVDSVMIMSLKADAIRKMKSIRPDWKCGQLLSVSAGKLGKSEADFLAVNATFADRRFVRTAHKAQKEVYVWTVNDAATMSTMIGRGVDGLITDKPALARSVLMQRAHMSVPQRILLELAQTFGVEEKIDEQ